MSLLRALLGICLVILSLANLAVGKDTAAGPIAYEDVTKLLEDGTDEETILKKLEQTPTQFVLSDKQVAQLKKLKASDKLIAAMQAARANPAAAASAADDGGGASTTPGLAIVLDCSGSMQEKTKDGTTKMEAAKKALKDLVQKVPAGQRLALIVYGQDKALGCKAVQVVREMSVLDDAGKADLLKAVDAMQPVGGTPIALGLKTAGLELLKCEGACGLVLISDGLESCKGDPKAEAAELAKNPKLKFGVSVIGLGVKPEEELALKEISDAGKGKFVAASDAAELNVGIEEVVKPVVVAEARTGGRRGIRVLKPTVGMPAMKMIALTATPAGPNVYNYKPIAETKAYETVMRLPSDGEHFVWWVPQEGLPLLMLPKYSLKERKQVDIKPEDYLGMVQLGGADLPPPKLIALTSNKNGPDEYNFAPVQTCTKYGAVMVVPAGEYTLWMKPADNGIAEELETKLKVEAGKLTKVE